MGGGLLGELGPDRGNGRDVVMAVALVVLGNAGGGACSQACGAENCANGCCDADGVCVLTEGAAPGSAPYCGRGGGACVDCALHGLTCRTDGASCCAPA